VCHDLYDLSGSHRFQEQHVCIKLYIRISKTAAKSGRHSNILSERKYENSLVFQFRRE
jgi:hypothetical protein